MPNTNTFPTFESSGGSTSTPKARAGSSPPKQQHHGLAPSGSQQERQRQQNLAASKRARDALKSRAKQVEGKAKTLGKASAKGAAKAAGARGVHWLTDLAIREVAGDSLERLGGLISTVSDKIGLDRVTVFPETWISVLDAAIQGASLEQQNELIRRMKAGEKPDASDALSYLPKAELALQDSLLADIVSGSLSELPKGETRMQTLASVSSLTETPVATVLDTETERDGYPCDYPEQIDRRGRRCGGRAASIKPGGRLGPY